ncbi:IS3 family transposase [Exiguobacterium acetylicum]|uniref:IS3 family transposase n=1 Tax=Exiguobacterium acetylicum TaxID=41170 RepID=UPI003CC7F060|nr:IS3 family transposase [Exiguobacterium acetylicum]
MSCCQQVNHAKDTFSEDKHRKESESFHSNLKSEEFQYVKLNSLRDHEVSERVTNYLNYYNEERIQEKVGYLTPKKIRCTGSLIKVFYMCLILLGQSSLVGAFFMYLSTIYSWSKFKIKINIFIMFIDRLIFNTNIKQ